MGIHLPVATHCLCFSRTLALLTKSVISSILEFVNLGQSHSQDLLVLCGVTGTARGAKALEAEDRGDSVAHWTLSSQILPRTRCPHSLTWKGLM